MCVCVSVFVCLCVCVCHAQEQALRAGKVKEQEEGFKNYNWKGASSVPSSSLTR